MFDSVISQIADVQKIKESDFMNLINELKATGKTYIMKSNAGFQVINKTRNIPCIDLGL